MSGNKTDVNEELIDDHESGHIFLFINLDIFMCAMINTKSHFINSRNDNTVKY